MGSRVLMTFNTQQISNHKSRPSFIVQGELQIYQNSHTLLDRDCVSFGKFGASGDEGLDDRAGGGGVKNKEKRKELKQGTQAVRRQKSRRPTAWS